MTKEGRGEKPTTQKPDIRKFGTGASRDSNEGKYDYEAFLSPLVIEEYAKYMHKNRKMSDGSLRDGDNWQMGFGDKHYDVCAKSAWRHFFDFWKEHRGLQSREDIDSAICGLLFNLMAYYHKLLKERMVSKKGD